MGKNTKEWRVPVEQPADYVKHNTLDGAVLNYREAIQSAIDEASASGGGTVILEAGCTYTSACIVLRDNVELHFEDGAVLKQIPGKIGYTKYENGRYEPWEPALGHNLIREGVIWDHAWLRNFPFIFAPEGTKNVKITGDGTIQMDDTQPDCSTVAHVVPVGFYRVNTFEISDITIRGYYSYGMMVYTSSDGLIKGVKIKDYKCHNNDGLSLANSHNIRITECDFDTGDDSCYIFESYDDARGHNTWWSTEHPAPSENIEIDHCNFKSDGCKAFGFILWGYGCPDREKIDVRNIFVHDNHIATMGVWLRTLDPTPPISHVRFYNNVIDAIEDSFFKLSFNDVNFYHSMRQSLNPCFNDGRVFWTTKPNSNPDSVGVCRDKAEEGRPYGYIKNFEDGNAELYQGVYLESGHPCTVRVEVKTADNTSRLFVRETDSGEIITTKDFSHKEWTEEKITFTVPHDGNYQLGIGRGGAVSGFVKICNLDLRAGIDGAFGYDRCDRDDRTDILHYFYDTPESKLQGVKPNV